MRATEAGVERANPATIEGIAMIRRTSGSITKKTCLRPVGYFMVTFTLPEELRSVARSHQQVIFSYKDTELCPP